jgi:glycosyltransferase involved in cell wall biosynthesis
VITFIIPRFHTNLTGFVKGLLKDKQEIEILALRASSLENHLDVEPILLPKSFLMFSKIKWFKGSNFSAWDIPSIRILYKKITKNNSQVLIVRLEKSMFSMVVLSIALLKIKRQVLIYTQRSVPEENIWLRIIQIILYKSMNWKWISPVKKDNYQSTLEYQCWIPFATNVSDKPTFLSDQKSKIKIVTIGKLVPRKNLNLVIEIFQELNSPKFELEIISENSTEEHYRTKLNLKNMIKNGSKINFIENVEHHIVRKILEKSHIFILLSQKEPASVSNLEAMASGNLVIIGRDNGTANYIQNRKGGYIVDYIKEEVTKILREIENNPELITEMGTSNIREVEKKFENSIVSQQLLSFIQS